MLGLDKLRTDAPILGVYCVWSTATGEQYIGSSAHVRHRLLCMRSALGGSKSTAANRRMISDARTYGVHSFAASVVQLCRSEDEAEQVEKRLIAERKPEYNGTRGGGKARATRVVNGQVHCPCDEPIRPTRILCDGCWAAWVRTLKGKEWQRRQSAKQYQRVKSDPVLWARARAARKRSEEKQKADPTYKARKAAVKRRYMAKIKSDPQKYAAFLEKRRAAAKARRAKKKAQATTKTKPKKPLKAKRTSRRTSTK